MSVTLNETVDGSIVELTASVVDIADAAVGASAVVVVPGLEGDAVMLVDIAGADVAKTDEVDGGGGRTEGASDEVVAGAVGTSVVALAAVLVDPTVEAVVAALLVVGAKSVVVVVVAGSVVEAGVVISRVELGSGSGVVGEVVWGGWG